jgi:hypothetical protein
MAKNKYIETPEALWQLFVDYKAHVKDNPTKVKDWVGKDAEMVYREKEKPLTMVGFECFVCDNTDVSYPDLTAYFENKNESYKAYFPISSRIQAEIKNDQLSGGLTMIYSQSLTARINNLAEKTETKIEGGLNIPDIGNRS